jgi:hypothetical protein
MPKESRISDNAEIYKPRKQQTEKEKLRDMPMKKKLAYLWEYYRVPAFVTIAALALISYTIYTIASPKVDVKFNAIIMENPFDEQVLEDCKADFSEYLKLDPQKEKVDFNSSFYKPETMGEILTTYVAAQEIDVIIARESVFATYAYIGYFDRLSDQLPTDLYSSLTNQFYLSDTQENTEKNAYGIYLTDTALFKNHSISTDPYVLGIVTNSKHKENGVEFLRYLFQLFP